MINSVQITSMMGSGESSFDLLVNTRIFYMLPVKANVLVLCCPPLMGLQRLGGCGLLFYYNNKLRCGKKNPKPFIQKRHSLLCWTETQPIDTITSKLVYSSKSYRLEDNAKNFNQYITRKCIHYLEQATTHIMPCSDVILTNRRC